MLRAEARQLNGANFASIFIDISGFCDNAQWPDLIQDGLALEYPPVLLELCLQVYAGPPVTRGTSSEPGPLSGLWIASRMPAGPQHLQNSVAFSTHRPLASNLDLWLDDISIDIQGQSPAQVAAKPLQAFRTLRDDLQLRSLPVNTVKTKIVASDGLTADQLRRQAQTGDPQVTDLARDLNVLNPQSKGRLRMVKGSMPAGTYGHCHLDRLDGSGSWLGHQCTVLDLFAKQIEDPKQQVIREHFQVLFRILKQDPSTWSGALQRLKRSPQPWKLMSGPLAAGIQYLRDVGWNVDKKDSWSTFFGDLRFDPADPWLPRPRNLQFKQAMWQGAILHNQNGGPAECQVCGQDNSLRHVLWDCPRWKRARKFPSHLQEMATRYPADVL